MSALDLADVLPDLSFSATAAAASLTLQLPDGTSLVGTYPAAGGDGLTVTRTGAGPYTYACSYVTTQPGRHVARWTATGEASTDAWNVADSDAVPLISLADIREQCRASATSSDQQLRWYGLVASTMAEDHTQRWRRRQVVQRFDGGQQALSLDTPVISVASVTEDGVTLTSSDWSLGAGGRLYRGRAGSYWCWSAGSQNVVATYTVGEAGGIIPEPVLQGVRLEVQHLWDTMRGGSGGPQRPGGVDFTTDPRTGYSIPNRVLELWRNYVPAGGTFVA